MLIPELQEFHKLFAQMDILKEKLFKFWPRDTLICDNVCRNGSFTPPGVEFWRTKIRFYPGGHRKTRQQHKVTNLRLITLRRKIKGLKKTDYKTYHKKEFNLTLRTTTLLFSPLVAKPLYEEKRCCHCHEWWCGFICRRRSTCSRRI